MATNERAAPYLALIDATPVDQVVDGGADPGNDVRQATPEGVVDPTTSSIYGASPMMRIASHKAGTLLTTVGIAGLDCTTGMVLGYIDREAGGAFSATGHKVAAAKCFVVPESLTVAVGEDAVVRYVGYAYSADGTTHPFAYTNALPAGTPGVAERYTMGTVDIVATPIGKVLSYSISFGIGVRLFRAGGDVYPTAVSIVSRNPVATIEVAKMGEITTARLAGGEISTVVFNLLARSLTGGALAGAGNHALTMAKAFVDIAQTRESGGGDAGFTLTARGRKDGATAILAIA